MNDFIERDGLEVFSEEFLDFAGYNLQRRALPDSRDGLKWGARKLLHAQSLAKLTYNKPFKKAIKSVSQAMSFSYTHGDASAYGTFIRMAKPFAYRYPLQEVNGNYGTLINPNDHSASRYVELRGSKIASILLEDLEKDTIQEWEDTYDLEDKFPKVLPAKGFWNGVNGCISIGSGMSSSLPPLNLKEVNKAMIKLLWDPNINEKEIICLPDFPTGAIILNKDEVIESLINGTGSACKIRASIEWEPIEKCLIVKQMPYSTYTNTICSEIAFLMEEDEKCGIKDFVDYTGINPDLRIYLQKNASPEKIIKLLYKKTSLETFFSINMTVLDNGIYPVVMGQKQLFQSHIDHEKIIYRRGFEYDLRKIKARLHIIEGM
jgi:DNA gyrase/topoisomerase IV subunit A